MNKNAVWLLFVAILASGSVAAADDNNAFRKIDTGVNEAGRAIGKTAKDSFKAVDNAVNKAGEAAGKAVKEMKKELGIAEPPQKK